MSSKLTTMNLYLEPAETRRLASLCGPFDDNIKQIERRVGVEIVRKNNHFQITGLPRHCLSANNLLKQLYIETQTVKGSTPDLDPEQVHLAIQEAIALEQDDSGDDKALFIKTRRGVIKPRNPNQSTYVANIVRHDITFGIGPAGTGKTYTISGLYLRLLLGDGLSEPLSCEQILVVTFTNAATEELRDRIRRRIQVAFKCFLGLEINDPFVQALYDKTPEAERAIALRRFDLALKSLDEAAIFTIHGFCQRILADLAFESSLLFESDFTLDDSEFLHHAVRDFWREACYPLPEYLAQIIASEFGDPDGLVKQLRALLGASEAKPLKPVQPFARLAESLSQSVQRFKLAWPRGPTDSTGAPPNDKGGLQRAREL